MHYERWRLHGDVGEAAPKRIQSTDPEVRIWSNIDVGDCWEWTGRKNIYGYGRVVKAMAHRVVYEALVGPIPEGMTLDHLCRNRACVNPDHLEPTSLKENLLRGEGTGAKNKRKNECVNGHPFNETNTYIYGNRRQCRVCHKERARARRHQ
jgi:hypothetical protein